VRKGAPVEEVKCELEREHCQGRGEGERVMVKGNGVPLGYRSVIILETGGEKGFLEEIPYCPEFSGMTERGLSRDLEGGGGSSALLTVRKETW